MKTDLYNLSVVIPVYNSEQLLPSLVNRLEPILHRHANKYEIIFVNDGSRDKSWDVIHKLCAQYPWIRGIDFMRNFGQHNALLAGIREAKYEVTVTMDDDLQNPPEEIPKLLDKYAEGYDIVYGTPKKERHGFLRDLASIITKTVLKSVMGKNIARNVSTFRIIKTDLRLAFASHQSHYVYLDVLLTWGAKSYGYIPVKHARRKEGVSNYTLRKLVAHALNMMTSFSVIPLKFASLMGFIFAVFGSLILAYVVGRFLLDRETVPGFPFLASIIAIFSGVQLLSLGIMGEYLARMHYRMMERPPYIVRKKLEETIK